MRIEAIKKAKKQNKVETAMATLDLLSNLFAQIVEHTTGQDTIPKNLQEAKDAIEAKNAIKDAIKGAIFEYYYSEDEIELTKIELARLVLFSFPSLLGDTIKNWGDLIPDFDQAFFDILRFRMAFHPELPVTAINRQRDIKFEVKEKNCGSYAYSINTGTNDNFRFSAFNQILRITGDLIPLETEKTLATIDHNEHQYFDDFKVTADVTPTIHRHSPPQLILIFEKFEETLFKSIEKAGFESEYLFQYLLVLKHLTTTKLLFKAFGYLGFGITTVHFTPEMAIKILEYVNKKEGVQEEERLRSMFSLDRITRAILEVDPKTRILLIENYKFYGYIGVLPNETLSILLDQVPGLKELYVPNRVVNESITANEFLHILKPYLPKNSNDITKKDKILLLKQFAKHIPFVFNFSELGKIGNFLLDPSHNLHKTINAQRRLMKKTYSTSFVITSKLLSGSLKETTATDEALKQKGSDKPSDLITLSFIPSPQSSTANNNSSSNSSSSTISNSLSSSST